MSRTWIRNTLGAVVIAVALVATIGEGGGSKSSSTPATASSSKAAPIAMGTSVSVAKGWDVIVHSANLNANADMAAGNQFNTPTAGTQYVSVNVSVTNNSSKPDSPFTNVKFSMLPPSGVGISSTFVAGIANVLSPSAQMQPGATATGVLVFEVPVDQVTGSVLLGEPVLTLDQSKDQKFFALA